MFVAAELSGYGYMPHHNDLCSRERGTHRRIYPKMGLFADLPFFIEVVISDENHQSGPHESLAAFRGRALSLHRLAPALSTSAMAYPLHHSIVTCKALKGAHGARIDLIRTIGVEVVNTSRDQFSKLNASSPSSPGRASLAYYVA
jgi:hypothetical protein